MEKARGNLIKDRRGEIGLSQNELAVLAKVSRSTVKNAEAGSSTISGMTRRRLERALGWREGTLSKSWPVGTEPYAQTILSAKSMQAIAKAIVRDIGTEHFQAIALDRYHELLTAYNRGQLHEGICQRFEQSVGEHLSISDFERLIKELSDNAPDKRTKELLEASPVWREARAKLAYGREMLAKKDILATGKKRGESYFDVARRRAGVPIRTELTEEDREQLQKDRENIREILDLLEPLAHDRAGVHAFRRLPVRVQQVLESGEVLDSDLLSVPEAENMKIVTLVVREGHDVEGTTPEDRSALVHALRIWHISLTMASFAYNISEKFVWMGPDEVEERIREAVTEAVSSERDPRYEEFTRDAQFFWERHVMAVKQLHDSGASIEEIGEKFGDTNEEIIKILQQAEYLAAEKAKREEEDAL